MRVAKNELPHSFATPQYSSVILSKFSEMRNGEKLCDTFISNEEVTLSVHSNILAAVSPFMLRYITSRATNCKNCSNRENLVIPITSITKMMNDSPYNCMECISEIINYIYSGSIKISDEHFDHIVNISCNLEIEQLIEICRNYNPLEMPSNDNIMFESYNCDNSDIPVYKTSNTKLSDSLCSSNNRNIKSTDTKTACDNNNTNFKFNSNTLSKSNVDSTDKLEKFSFKITNINIINDIYSLEDESTLSNETICLEKVIDIPSKILSSSSQICDKTNHLNSNSRTDVENKFLKFSSLHKDNYDSASVHSVEVTSCDKILDNPNCNSVTNLGDKSSFDKQSEALTSNKFICLFCKFKSNSYDRIAKHILKKKHGNKCSLCLFEYENNNDLIRHVEKNHKLSLSYTCDSCTLSFKSLHSLKSHLISHEEIGIKIKCDYCNKPFRNKTDVKLHILRSHNNNSDKYCDFCNYKTKFSSYLKRHLLKHNRNVIKCSFPKCGFQTVWKSNLKDHMKIHSKIENKFSCDTCKKTFSLKKNLQRHVLLMHKKCKEYTCPKCQYKNKRFDKVRAHCFKIHKLDSGIIEEFKNKNCDNFSTEDNDLDSSHQDDSNEKDNLNLYLKNASNSSPERLVYLNEATGELTFFCDSDGKFLKGVPDVITVHRFSGVGNDNNFDNSNSVILNETTGELTCIQLNFNCNSEKINLEKPVYSNPEVTVTVLDEATGEITSKHEQISLENDNMIDFDNMFDTIDFDAMNDDSFDGFDDFDNALFNAEFNVGSESPDMDKILNEFTGELFTDDTACQYSLNKQLQQGLWQSNIQAESNSHTNPQVEEFSQIFLDEVTGELTADFSSLLN